MGLFEGTIGNFLRVLRLDPSTHAAETIGVPHSEAHKGSRFYVHYSVVSLGALLAPNDMMTLTWITPDTTKWRHFTFYGAGTGGWRMRLIEAPTGGGVSPTGKFAALNNNRNSAKVSTTVALDGAAGQVSYDATLVTGGTSLWDDFLPGGNKLTGSGGSDRDEIIQKQGTKYQLSLFGTDTDPGTLHIDWYEHTDKN